MSRIVGAINESAPGPFNVFDAGVVGIYFSGDAAGDDEDLDLFPPAVNRSEQHGRLGLVGLLHESFKVFHGSSASSKDPSRSKIRTCSFTAQAALSLPVGSCVAKTFSNRAFVADSERESAARRSSIRCRRPDPLPGRWPRPRWESYCRTTL